MTTELRSLGAAELTRLGGLKTQCRAALLCSEHNAPYPCEVCVALDSKSVACSACLQEFPEGLSTTGDRPCASQAVFEKTGRVAFEAEAIAALAERAREKESARERRKREKEAADRAREEQARKEAADREAREREGRAREAAERAALERVRAERERAEREKKERKEPAPAPVPAPTPEPVPEADRVQGERRARMAVWASLFSAIAGAYTLWQAPLIDMPSASIGVLIAYAVTVMLVWFFGLGVMVFKDPVHATLRWWAPLAWAFMTFAWPGVAGLAVAYLFGVGDLGFLTEAVNFVLGVGLVAAAYCCIMYGGVALTMRPPWPSAFSGREFRALRSGWVWLALVATLALNVTLADGSGRLLEGGTGWGGASTGLSRKPLIEKLDKKPLPNKDMTGFVRAALADIAEAVNDHPRLATPFAPGVLPQVDAAVAALARLPRPPAGDRARAKELNNQANQLMARKSDWSEIADLMAQAHAADPQDAEILNFLAYSQMQSGRHTEALKNILESLRLAPTSANGWNRLAQIRLAAAKGDARQIQEASRYYVVTYWFSRDRPRVMRYFNGELTVGPGDSPDNPAAVSIALQRLPK